MEEFLHFSFIYQNVVVSKIPSLLLSVVGVSLKNVKPLDCHISPNIGEIPASILNDYLIHFISCGN